VEAVNIPMIFIIPVVITSLIAGRKAGILTSLLAVASFDFFFVQPYFSFSFSDVRLIPTFLVLFIVGIITSLLADTVKKQVEYTRQRETFISSLYDLSKDLLTSHDLDDILEKSTRYISESFNYDVLILLPNDDNNNLEVVSRFGTKRDFDKHENGVATWVFQHGQAAGCGTETLSSSKWFHIPLKAQEKIMGIMALSSDVNITTEQRHLIEAFASVISLALSNLIP
jgi:two-component system sensor histidine kinase KdpD